MKVRNIFLLGLFIGLIASCDKDNTNGSNTFSFSGKAQKGPFVAGTNVTLNELNSNLSQTGKSFITTITAEIYGELSGATLSRLVGIWLKHYATPSVCIMLASQTI